MATEKTITNLRGPAARISEVTAVPIPAGAGTSVTMTGPDQNRKFHFELERGLPGVNAVENDAAVAAYVAAVDSDTRQQVDGAISSRIPTVIVGAGGDYATINDALAAFPNGGVHIDLQPGVHVATTITPTADQKYVKITGQGRYTSKVEVAGPFIDAPMNADAWVLKDFGVRCTVNENTHDGIKVDYPRRWDVDTIDISGFGGTSIWYRGGIHSSIKNNFIIAKDYANVNGFAGVRVDRSSTNVVSTCIRTSRNYVATGKQYGFYFVSTNVGTVFSQDIAELCDVGMRFEVCTGELRSPYTEGNRVAGIQTHDSTLVYVGRFRDLPVSTWASVAGSDRFPVYVGNSVINTGKALIFGPNGGPTITPDSNVSIRQGVSDPNGGVTGPAGSLYLRTGGASGRTLYVKDSGAGNTGWVPVGSQSRANTGFVNASDSINTSGKYAGMQAWNTSVNRPVWASGSAPTAPWHYADGTVAHTPS